MDLFLLCICLIIFVALATGLRAYRARKHKLVTVTAPLDMNYSVLNGPTGVGPEMICVAPPPPECVPKICLGELRQLKEMDETCTCRGEVTTCTHDKKDGLHLYGPATAYLIPQIAKGCACNEYIGVRNRVVFKKPNEATRGMLERLNSFFESTKRTVFGDQKRKCEIMTDQGWLKYVPSKKREMYKEGMSQLHKGKDVDYKIKAFIKQEAILKNEPFDPRIIQGRDVVYNCVIGPTILTASKILSASWSVFNNRCKYVYDEFAFPVATYASGYTRNKLGLWHQRSMEFLTAFSSDIVVYENDFSRWDRTVCSELIELEFKVYKWFFKLPAKVQRGLKAQLKNLGYTRHGVKYTSEGTRKSGDQNTSVGNTILNALIHLFIFCEASGITDPSKLPIRSIFLGDDGYILCDRKLAAKALKISKQIYLELGLKAKARIAELHEAEFCSSIFVPVNGTYILAPKPGRILCKTFYSRKKLNFKKQQQWVKGICQGFLGDVSVFPWLVVLFRSILARTTHVKAWRDPDKFHQYTFRSESVVKADWESVDYLCRRYSISVSDLKEVTNWIANHVIDYNSYIAHPILASIHEVDVGPIMTD